MDLMGKRILVVGATGAIGSAISNLLLSNGAQVFGTASSQGSSARLRADLPLRLLLDLEKPDSIEAVASYLKTQVAALDGLVLASGLVAFGNLEDTPRAVTERLTTVNFTGQVELVRAVLPLLKQSASQNLSPFVVSFSGVIAEMPMAGLASYSASKTALHGFATAAAKELRKQGITWLDARPGHTETGLATRAIYGVAPSFGSGLATETVANRVLSAILNDEKDLPSSSFKS